MKVGIILNRVNFEEKQIIQALEADGHKVEQLNNQQMILQLDKSEKDDKIYTDFDVVLQRSLSLSRSLYSSVILESKGVKVVNDYESTRICGDKLLTSLKLIEHGINTPKTIMAFTVESAIQGIEEQLGYPCVVKPTIGSWGRLVAKLENKNGATAVLEDRDEMGDIYQKMFYLQEFLGPDRKPKNAPTDIRVIYIGGECVAAMGRIQQGDDFRSNIALGGLGVKYELDAGLISNCKKIAKATGGEFLGIDMMKTNEGYTCIEVNGTPQFQGISKATGVDIGQVFVNYLEKKYG
jgi:[lysine-biosynthesis-protein LysW]---L-2-aminoadipate ligase